MADMPGPTGSVTITKENTIALNGEGSKDPILPRCEQIRGLIEKEATSKYDRTKLQERLAKLSGSVAVIRVGKASEVENGEKKDRHNDALNATRAAVEDDALQSPLFFSMIDVVNVLAFVLGILPEGGTALLKAWLKLSTTSPTTLAGWSSYPVDPPRSISPP